MLLKRNPAKQGKIAVPTRTWRRYTEPDDP
jgi:hypothetical protein